jgi:hypothetical protein
MLMGLGSLFQSLRGVRRWRGRKERLGAGDPREDPLQGLGHLLDRRLAGQVDNDRLVEAFRIALFDRPHRRQQLGEIRLGQRAGDHDCFHSPFPVGSGSSGTQRVISLSPIAT